MRISYTFHKNLEMQQSQFLALHHMDLPKMYHVSVQYLCIHLYICIVFHAYIDCVKITYLYIYIYIILDIECQCLY